MGGNLLKENNYNYVCLSSYEEEKKPKTKGYGYFGEKVNNPGASYATQRVWLNNQNSDFYANDDWGTPCKNAIGYYDKDKWNVIVMPSVINSYDSNVYYYADIPASLTSIHFMRVSQSENHSYLVYQDRLINSLNYGACYFSGINGYDDYLNMYNAPVMSADATLLSMVVESYLTYGKDLSNGCVESTIKNLFSTWFANKSATNDDLKNAKILDYTGYSSNGNSYEGLTKNSSFSVNEKWNTMCSQADIDPKTGEARGNWLLSFGSNTMALVIIGGVSVVAVIGALIYIILKRKKTY